MSALGFAFVYFFGFSIEDFIAGLVPLLTCLLIVNFALRHNPNR